ncbi:MAG TPA: hypothetical protein VLH79_06800 [Chthonomonadales bacterium]|nr:hypothetical protein [Chthonomonadales bacterium]
MKHRLSIALRHLAFVILAAAVPAAAQPTLPTPSTKTITVAGDDTYVLKYPTATQFIGANPFPSIKLLDSDSSHNITLSATSNLTGNRTLSLVTGDSNRSITLAGDLSFGGNLTTSGAYATTLTATANTTITLPTTGTLATLAGTETLSNKTLSGPTYLNASGPVLVDSITGKPARGGIISTGAAAVGTTQDNTGLAAGTSDRSGSMWVRLADWTPAANVPLFTKFANNLGTKLWLVTTGVLRLEYGNGSNFTTYRYDSSVATGVTDGAWAHIAWSEDRSANLVFYVNGVALGAAVDISGSVAQTVTNTGALLWGSDGTTHAAGTFGECAKVSGLLTATQIRDIYTAGSIAPYCAFAAPSATTGQSVATIGGLSFYQWLDCGQGYGPIIKDRSGNNQVALMGTSGLTHAVPLSPRGNPSRAPRTAVVIDGSNGAFARSTLVSQNPSTGDFTLWWDGIFPSDASAASRPLVVLTPTIDTANAARAFILYYHSAVGLSTYLVGATTNDIRTRYCASFFTLLAGKRGTIAAVRSSTGIKAYLGFDGDWLDITNLFAESTAGTAPAWTDQVNGVYSLVAEATTSSSGAFSLYDLRLANVALTEAQLRTEYERGEPGPEWVGASATELVTNGDFASGTGWTVPAGFAIGSGVASATAAAPGATLFRSVAHSPGRKYRVRFTVSNYSAGSVTPVIGGSSGGQTNGTARSANGTYEETITAPTITGTAIAGVFAATTFTADIDGFSVVALGYTARLRTDTAAGLTALNSAKSATNDSTDFLLSTTGVTTSPDGRRQVIRATTNTNTWQQLAGASVIDTTKKWRIASWTITSSGTPTVTLSHTNSGTTYLSGGVLAAAQNEVTLATRIPASANLYCTSSDTSTLNHVVILEQVD